MTPFFSVIVPVYKAEAYLPQCVDSILSQTFGDFELFLIDDGSPDGCGVLCDEYAAKDSRVTAVHQANAGPTPARRNGLNRARGAYVCFVDSDDWVVPHWLETVKRHIDAHGGPDMVLYDVSYDVGQVDQPMLAEEGYYDKSRLEAEVYPYMLSDLRKSFGTQLFPGYLVTKVGKRELIAEHFISEDGITVMEDVSMVYECLYYASSAYISREQLYVYRQLEQSNLNHYRPRYFHEMILMQNYLKEHLGGRSRALDIQINAFCMRRLIFGIAGECVYHRGILTAARNAGRQLDETGFAREMFMDGLPLFYRLFLLVVKLRLYFLATLAVKLRM